MDFQSPSCQGPYQHAMFSTTGAFLSGRLIFQTEQRFRFQATVFQILTSGVCLGMSGIAL